MPKKSGVAVTLALPGQGQLGAVKKSVRVSRAMLGNLTDPKSGSDGMMKFIEINKTQ